jgi:predicted transcriptional regulator
MRPNEAELTKHAAAHIIYPETATDVWTRSRMTETNFTFRVEDDLKDRFVGAAQTNDLSASMLLREFMQTYVEKTEHDAWFRQEVEQGLAEAESPEVKLIPHEDVVARIRASF